MTPSHAKALRLACGSPPAPAWVGSLRGTASGFTSFVAHAGGLKLLWDGVR